MEHIDGKWAKQILDCRDNDGMWGNFHTLSRPISGKAYTTEQALRRLRILGYTIDDEAIKTIVNRMELCVKGEKKLMIIMRKPTIGFYLKGLCFRHGLDCLILKTKLL